MDNKWLLSEEQIMKILEKSMPSNRWIPKKKDLVAIAQVQLNHAEPLIRQDEAKKYEGWKSLTEHNKECAEIAAHWQRGISESRQDEHTRTLKAVGKYLSQRGWFNSAGYESHLDDIELLLSGVEPEGMER